MLLRRTKKAEIGTRFSDQGITVRETRAIRILSVVLPAVPSFLFFGVTIFSDAAKMAAFLFFMTFVVAASSLFLEPFLKSRRFQATIHDERLREDAECIDSILVELTITQEGSADTHERGILSYSNRELAFVGYEISFVVNVTEAVAVMRTSVSRKWLQVAEASMTFKLESSSVRFVALHSREDPGHALAERIFDRILHDRKGFRFPALQ